MPAREIAAAGSDWDISSIEPCGRRAASGVAEKAENIDQPRAGHDALVADVTEADMKIIEEFDFQLVARREISVAAFAGEDVVLRAVPVHSGLPSPVPAAITA